MGESWDFEKWVFENWGFEGLGTEDSTDYGFGHVLEMEEAHCVDDADGYYEEIDWSLH